MQKTAVALLLLLSPALAFAQTNGVQVSQKVTVDGDQVPVTAVVAQGSEDVVLSSTKTDGAVPVTFTLYLKPKPKPAPTPTSTQAAAVESSQGIQNSIAGISPQVASTTAPFFTLVDGARDSAANIIADQLTKTKAGLGTDAGKVLGAEATKNAASNPGGTFWYILQTLYLYILTLLGFIVNSAGVFYPVFAVVVLFLLWKLFGRFRRPAY